MKFKKIMLITLLLLAVLTIGSVSAGEDGDALAVDDMGDEAIVEAPVDDVTETSVADEDIIEDSQSTDTLSSAYVYFNNKNITESYDEVCSISDYDSYLNGTVSIFANGSQVYSSDISEEYSVTIWAGDLFGKFYGTYNMELIYNGADGNKYTQEGTVNFAELLINNLLPEDFDVTFPNTEFDMDKGDPVVIRYFTPEGIHQYSADLVVYYGEGDFDYCTIQMNINDVGTYKNLTWGDLWMRDPGVFNLRVYYAEGMRDFLGLGNATINATYNHEYTAEDFIYIYNYVGHGEDEDCLAEIYDDEIKGLNGVVTAYADGSQIYTKTHSNSTKGGPIHAKDLSGYFNGTYTVKVEYKRADGKVFSISRDVYFDNIGTAGTIKTTLTASPTSVSMAYNTNKVLTVTLKDANNKPIKDQNIKVYIMGTSYDLKTDKDGKVKQSLSSLPPGTNNIKFEFKAVASYKGSTKTVTVKVTKATPKLTAANKAFKKSQSKKSYAVTLKTNTGKVMKNAKVTLTVNKKTYTAKTNSKGQATFKITNLKKKGKYAATVKYGGNSYYNAKTVKPKITVK